MIKQVDRKNFMIFAKLRSGGVLPLVLGTSPQDCFARLPLAIDHWDQWMYQQLDEYWVSNWRGTPSNGYWSILDWIKCPKQRIRDIVMNNPANLRTNFILKD